MPEIAVIGTPSGPWPPPSKLFAPWRHPYSLTGSSLRQFHELICTAWYTARLRRPWKGDDWSHSMEHPSSDIIEFQSLIHLSRFHHGVCTASYTRGSCICGRMMRRNH
jgi:hypothetical protein